MSTPTPTPGSASTGVDPDILTAVAGSASVLVAALAIAISVVAYRNQRMSFMTDVRQRWEELRDDWATVVLLWDPGHWYYSDASGPERARIKHIQDDVLAGADVSETLRTEAVHVRRVVRFLAYVADAVFRGRISVAEAYVMFGPDVVRLRSAVVWASGMDREVPTAMPSPIEPAWLAASTQIPSGPYWAQQEDVVAFIDLLSARMATIGDTRAHYLLMRAEELRDGGLGRESRRRIRRAVLRRNHPFRALRLTQLARRAERVPIDALEADREPLLYTEARVFGPPIVRGPFARRRYRRIMSRGSSMD